MKAASAATLALLASNEYLMAELYTITLLSGTVLRYTDADGDLYASLGGSVIQSGTAQAGAPNSLTLSNAASTTPDIYANLAARITGGTGAGQERKALTSRVNYLKNALALGNTDCTITLNAATAPDGTNTATLVSDADATSSPSLVFDQSYPSFPAGTKLTASIPIKAGTSATGTFNCYAAGDTESNVSVTWSGGVPSLGTLNNCTAVITPDAGGNGWYWLAMTWTTVGTGIVGVRYWPCARNTTGLTGSTYIWSRQLEIGSVATPLIQTLSAAAVGVAVATPFSPLPDGSSVYELDSYQQYVSTSPNILRDKTATKVGIEVDDMTVTLYAGVNDLISGIPWPQFIANGGFDGARLQVDRCFMATYGDTSAGVVNIFSGSISDVTPSRSEIALTVSSDAQLLNLPMPRNLYGAACSHTLYDAGCGAVKASFGFASSCASGSTAQVINCALIQPATYFDAGTISCTGGANAGATRTVKRYTPGVLNLSLPLPFAPTIGDTFTAYFGCDKTKATCAAKFVNLGSFRGFPFVAVPEASL